MTKPVVTPFTTAKIKPLEVVIPPDLRELVDQSEQIRRLSHPDYPQGMRADNVKTHTIRMVHSALTLKLSPTYEVIRPALIRTLWLHDLPEIPNATSTGQDVSAVSQHDDPALEASVASDELNAAQQLFSPADLTLWLDFEAARDTLSGRPSQPNPTPAAIIARILDIGDGETGFYHFLVAWMLDSSFDGHMPTTRPYEFTLDRYKSLISRLAQLSLDGELNQICTQLIKDQSQFIVNNLAPVRRRLPPAGRHLIDGLQ